MFRTPDGKYTFSEKNTDFVSALDLIKCPKDRFEVSDPNPNVPDPNKTGYGSDFSVRPDPDFFLINRNPLKSIFN